MQEKYSDNLFVSIISPAYNSAQYISEMIESVQKQTHPLWELIVIDDASQDKTAEIVAKYAKLDERVKLICLTENKGIANARNVGLNLARYDLIAFLDSDDLWLPQKLEKQVNFMRQKKAALTYTKYGRFFTHHQQVKKYIDVPTQVTYQELLKGNVLGNSTVMLDRTIIGEIRLPVQQNHEDYVTWLSILKKGYVAYGLGDDLVRYRLSSTSVSGNKAKSASWVWSIYRRVEKLSFLKSSYYFAHYVWRGLKNSF